MRTSEYGKRTAIVRSVLGKYGISPLEKRALGQSAKSILRATAKAMGLKTGEFDVRFNPGGSAGAGSAVLHTDSLYVQIDPENDFGVLVRSCQGRKDYSGGQNNWIPWKTFLSEKQPIDLAKRIQTVVPGARPLARPMDPKTSPETGKDRFV